MPELETELRAYEPRVDDLTLVYRQKFTLESNWKNVVDNYNENYHTPKVHPILSSILDDSYRVVSKGLYFSHQGDASPGIEGGFEVKGPQLRRFSHLPRG